MHTKTFAIGPGELCRVNYNSDFGGMAYISWGKPLEMESAIVPAIVLTLGIAEIADALFKLAETAMDLKDEQE